MSFASARPTAQASSSSASSAAEHLVFQLTDPDTRERALQDLSKKREVLQDLAPLLWNAHGAIFALLQEIVSICKELSPPKVTSVSSNRVCNALALLQCVASHPDTRIHFLNGMFDQLHRQSFDCCYSSQKLIRTHIPLYLYPFLNTTSSTRPFEYLRLTSLGVIGALVKVDDNEVITFLLSTEIVPLCLRSMEMGSELSKTVATFIIQKILLDDVGLNYVCTTPGRVVSIIRVFGSMVRSLPEQPSQRLLKHLVRCYLRLSEDKRACKILLSCIPVTLKDGTFNDLLHDDPATRRWLQQLLHNISVIGAWIAALRAAGVFDQMMRM